MSHQALMEKKGSLAKEIRRLADKANDDKQEWLGEDEQTWERVNKEFDETVAELEKVQQRLDMLSRASNIEDALKDQRKIGREDRRGVPGGDGPDTEITDEHRMLALQAWIRANNDLDITERQQEACQLLRINPMRRRFEIRLTNSIVGENRLAEPCWASHGSPILERRALSVGTANAGGYTVPTGFMTELERTLLAFNGPRQVCRVIRTDSGEQILWPTVDDTSNTGEQLNEAATIGSSVDPTFGQKALDAYKYSSKPILVSEELLEDSAFALANEIASMLGERLGRIQAARFTTGTGSSQPNGIVTASTLGKTAADDVTITADEIIDLVHSVDPAYRSDPSCGFMFNDAIALAIRKFKSTDNQYIWQPGLQFGVPDRILGYPYAINQQMASTIAASAKVMLFGAMAKFIIRDVGGIRLYRLEELYRANDQVGFIAFQRADSECIQTAAIKHMITAAS